MTDLAREVGRMQRDRLGATGNTLFLASDKAGEQSVFHLHLHVVPRMEGDGLDLSSWWMTKVHRKSHSALDAVAAKLRGGAAA